jgi:hypothetical protein
MFRGLALAKTDQIQNELGSAKLLEDGDNVSKRCVGIGSRQIKLF